MSPYLAYSYMMRPLLFHNFIREIKYNGVTSQLFSTYRENQYIKVSFTENQFLSSLY